MMQHGDMNCINGCVAPTLNKSSALLNMNIQVCMYVSIIATNETCLAFYYFGSDSTQQATCNTQTFMYKRTSAKRHLILNFTKIVFYLFSTLYIFLALCTVLAH